MARRNTGPPGGPGRRAGVPGQTRAGVRGEHRAGAWCCNPSGAWGRGPHGGTTNRTTDDTPAQGVTLERRIRRMQSPSRLPA